MRTNLQSTEALLAAVVTDGQWSPTDVRRSVDFKPDFECRQAVCDLTGTQFAALASSGSMALRFGLEALGVGWGDTVMIPASTWIAVLESVLAAGARPLLVPCDELGNIDVHKIRTLSDYKPRAAIVVHTNGVPVNVPAVRDALPADCFVLEDFSQAHSATWRGVPVGGLGDAAACSFHATKLVSCGEGGAFVANDEDVVSRFELLTTNGRPPRQPRIGSLDYASRHSTSVVASNARLSTFAAAVLRAQLEGLPSYLDACRSGALRLAKAWPSDVLTLQMMDRPGQVPYGVRFRPRIGHPGVPDVLKSLVRLGLAKPLSGCLHQLAPEGFLRPSLRWFQTDILMRQFGEDSCGVCQHSDGYIIPHQKLTDEGALQMILHVLRDRKK